MHRLSFLLFISMAVGCDMNIESEKPCRATNDGWVCDDMGGVEDMFMMMDMPRDTNNANTNNDSTNNANTNNDSTNNANTNNTNNDTVVPQPPATSCRELKVRGVATGIHTIEVGTREVSVHCNMDFDGGGWMLVGRSTETGADSTFGWRSRNGSLSDLNTPFSMGESDFPFTEILVTSRNADFTIGDRAYRLTAPANFWSDCQNSGCSVAVQVVAGPCNDVSMLNNAGFNSASGSFYFRDVASDTVSGYGLTPQGFNTFYENCVGGELHTRQGMIFVR